MWARIVISSIPAIDVALVTAQTVHTFARATAHSGVLTGADVERVHDTLDRRFRVNDLDTSIRISGLKMVVALQYLVDSPFRGPASCHVYRNENGHVAGSRIDDPQSIVAI